jgi:hypothetical protein
MKSILALAFIALMPIAALAQPPVVADVQITRDDMGWQFSVTVRHDDTGWDHYADRWEILAEDGTLLATRALPHPHVDEQPLTRSLRQVMLPDGTRRVYIRAHCSSGDLSAVLTPVEIPL